MSSSLNLIPEERISNKISLSTTKSAYSNNSSGRLPYKLNKRKILQPLPNQSNMITSTSGSVSGKSDRRNIAGRVLSAKEHRMRQLQNQLTDAQYHLNELYRENRLLKSIQKRQDSALQRYENANGDIPKLINSHNEEMRSLQVRYKQLKLQLRDMSQKIKDKDNELYKLTEDHKKLLELSKDMNLGERESLRSQVKELTDKVQRQNETISNLQRKSLLEEKTHKRQIHLEMTKHKETQLQLANALNHSNHLNSVIEIKEKLLANNNTRKLFPKINHQNITKSSSQTFETKYRQNSVNPVHSPKENMSSDVSLDSNLKFSSSSTFSIVGKSLQQSMEDFNKSVNQTTNRNSETSDKDNDVKNNMHYEEAIHVGLANTHVSESDTDPPRSSDEDVRERVENMKRHIRKQHRNEAEATFEDIRNMIQNTEKISRGTLSTTSEDSSNGQLIIDQIDKALSRSISKQSGDKSNDNTKSLVLDLGNTDYNSILNITNGDANRDYHENSFKTTNDKNTGVNILTDYLTRRSSNEYDSDNQTVDIGFWQKKSHEMNNNSIATKETKSDLDSEKKKKLLAALKAIDRGEDQGLLFNTSKRNSVSSRISNQ